LTLSLPNFRRMRPPHAWPRASPEAHPDSLLVTAWTEDNLAHVAPFRPRRQQHHNPLLPHVISAAVLQLSLQ
jgi:hypothetical protein